MLGTQYLQHGEPRKAVDYFKRTLSLKPDYDLAVFNLAQAYRRLGDDDAALAGFEHYLTIDPKDPFVHYQIGEIWLDRGDLAKAEEQFRQALDIDPNVASAKNALGVIALAARRPGRRRAADPRGDRDEAGRAPGALQPGAARRTARRRSHGGARVLRRAEATPRQLQGGVQPVAALRAGRRSRRADRRARSSRSTSNPQFAEGHVFLAKAYLDSGGSICRGYRSWRRRDSSWRRNRSTRRSATTSSRTLQPAGPRAVRRRSEVARGRALGKRRADQGHTGPDPGLTPARDDRQVQAGSDQSDPGFRTTSGRRR